MRTKLGLIFSLVLLVHVDASAQSASERARALSESTGSRSELPGVEQHQEFPLSLRDKAPARDISLDVDLPTPERLPRLESCQGCNPNGCTPAAPSPPSGALSGLGLVVQILGVLALAALLFMVVRILIRRGAFTRLDEEENELVREARAQDEDAVERATDQSDWNRAIHALWLATLLELVQRGHRIPRAWTAREIGGRLPIGDEARLPLDRLRYLAELAAFANHTSTEDEFREAERVAAHTLAQALSVRTEER